MNLLLFVQNFEVVFNGSRPQNKFLTILILYKLAELGQLFQQTPGSSQKHHSKMYHSSVIEIIPLLPPLSSFLKSWMIAKSVACVVFGLSTQRMKSIDLNF